jgi:hypothetical protein
VLECRTLIEKLRDSHIRCPLDIRQAFLHLQDTVVQQEPENVSVVLSCFFLHFLCPALLQPSKYGLTESPSDDLATIENLILGCKVCWKNSTPAHIFPLLTYLWYPLVLILDSASCGEQLAEPDITVLIKS